MKVTDRKPSTSPTVFRCRSLAIMAGLLLPALSARASLSTVDQQDSKGGSGSLASNYGQSFTPALTSLNAVDFFLTSQMGSTVQVNLYAGTGYNGTLLGSSAVMTIAADPNVTITLREFTFAAPISLTPGTTYTFRLVGTSYFLGYDSSNGYSGGTELDANGNTLSSPSFPGFPPSTTYDLTFAEGTVAPEPAVWMMLLCGLGWWGVGRLRGVRPASSL